MLCSACCFYTALAIFQSGYRKSLKFDNGAISYLVSFLLYASLAFALSYFEYTDKTRDVVAEMTESYTQTGTMMLFMLSGIVQLQIIGEFFSAAKAMKLLSKAARAILIISCVILIQAWVSVFGFLSAWYQSLNLTEAQLAEHYWLALWIAIVTILSCLIAFSSWVAMRNALESSTDAKKPEILQKSDKREELPTP